MFKLLLCAMLLFLSLWGSQGRAQTAAPSTGGPDAISQSWVSQGALTQQDHDRATGTIGSVRQTGKVSDADLDWLLSLLQRPTSNPVAVHLLVMAGLINLTSVSEDQSRKIQAAMAPFERSSDSTEQQLSTLVVKTIRQSTQTRSPWPAIIAVLILGGAAFLVYRRVISSRTS